MTDAAMSRDESGALARLFELAGARAAEPRADSSENHAERQPTVVDGITEQLAYRIAAGIHQPGELLPSVRQVAAEFGTSAPTANSALGRLAALGFVEPRRGLGYLVRDIHLYGGIDTWRYLFRFARQLPDRAAMLFADVIDIDHMLVMEAFTTFLADPHRYDLTLAIQALDRFELLVADENARHADLLAAELHMLRCVFAALDKPGSLSLFNTIGEVLILLPEVGEAFYEPAGPAAHLFLGRLLQEIWQSHDELELPDTSMLETIVRDYHDQVVVTFRRLIGASA
ncbi:GntR family transcriptional regulator [Nocardia altamirensis]|uniref:GntR family transcriptional regulator n=1 Tax=Nocardia altamirensis TaxID=472158 RepID=UPI00084081C2|nr:GntR family transcriptional regulator [Nocardia altamirensis]